MLENWQVVKFPSPYGVSFILIYVILVRYTNTYQAIKFPSPYGVSFILIYKDKKEDATVIASVSVSLRSIIHSYSIENQ